MDVTTDNMGMLGAAHSPTIGAIAGALSKAQAELANITKQHTAQVRSKRGDGASYSYTYASLADVNDTIREPLAKNGLAISQLITSTDRGDLLVTMLMHAESGEWLRSAVLLPVAQGADAQAVGSAITYMRRYSILAMLNIATEDDDGAAATRYPPRNGNGQRQQQRPAQARNGNGRPATQQQPARQQSQRAESAGEPPAPETVEALEQELAAAGIRDARIFAMTTVKRTLNSLDDLTVTEIERVRARLREQAEAA